MEILINKKGREYLDWTEVINAIDVMHLPRFCSVEKTRKEAYDLAYYCKNCGCHLQGKWKEQRIALDHVGHACTDGCKSTHDCENIRKIIKQWEEQYSKPIWNECRKEKIELAQLTHCPICGAELNRGPGFFFANVIRSEHPMFSDVQVSEYSYTHTLLPSTIQKEKELLEQKAEQFSLSCDIPAPFAISSDHAEAICTSPARLKEYLQHLIEMEIGIYSLISRLKTLYIQQADIQRSVVRDRHLPLFTKRNEIEVAESVLLQKIKKAERYMSGQTGIAFPSKPNPPILTTPNLFNKKRVLAENEALKAQYQSELKAYEDQLSKCEAKRSYMISQAKDEARQAKTTLENLKKELLMLEQTGSSTIPAISAKKLVDDEIEKAEGALRKLYECRNKLYGYNIVFGKYRNVVALSTFYEYLMAGRCSALDGSNGAYNLYENEIRANMIIGQLSQVISKLEEIKEAQYMIYSELHAVNKHLDHLNHTMDAALTSIQNMEKDIASISENTDVIAHNSAVTAYYSKINAELTNSIGYLMAYKL